MTPPALFLFDLDGTLVTTGGAGLKALALAFEELFGLRDLVPTINPSGKTDPAIFRELVRAGLRRDVEGREESALIAERYLFHLDREMRASRTRVLHGVREFVAHLSDEPNVFIGLGTGNLERGARLKLAPTGLNDFFPFGGFGSDAEDRAEVLTFGHRRAQDRAGGRISPERVFVIGDTTLDIKAAQRAGFRSIAVASGGVSLPALRAAAPDAAIESMADAFELLKELLPQQESAA